MSALLSHDQIEPVILDLELLKEIRRAIADLRESELSAGDSVRLTLSTRQGVDDQPFCYVHDASPWLASVALQAMEREVSNRLKSKDIEVEAQA